MITLYLIDAPPYATTWLVEAAGCAMDTSGEGPTGQPLSLEPLACWEFFYCTLYDAEGEAIGTNSLVYPDLPELKDGRSYAYSWATGEITEKAVLPATAMLIVVALGLGVIGVGAAFALSAARRERGWIKKRM